MPYSLRPREGDTRCPDGFACYGWRKVCKGGYVLWYGRRYHNPDLKDWAGLFVWVEISDWLASGVDVFSAQGDRDKIECEMESDADYCARKGIVTPTPPESGREVSPADPEAPSDQECSPGSSQ